MMSSPATCIVVGLLLAGSILPAQSSGSLSGTVRADGSGQPVAGVEVVLPGFKLRDTTNEFGRYRIPAVPAGPTLLVGRKDGREEHSAAVTIKGNTPKEYDFVLRSAPATADGSREVAAAVYRPSAQPGVSGVVREDSTRRPVPGASVVVEALKREVITDAAGRYVLSDLPVGSQVIQVRKIGLEPNRAVVEVKSGTTLSRDFAMGRPAVKLDTMLVTDRKNKPFGFGVEGFEDRRRMGFGKFIDSTELRRNEHRTLGDMLRTVSGVTLANPPYCGQPYAIGENRYVRTINCVTSRSHLVALAAPLCAMQVSIDGVVFIPSKKIDNSEPPIDPANDWTSTINISTILLTDVMAVEIYRRNGEIPMEYRGNTECGLMLVWTRRGR